MRQLPYTVSSGASADVVTLRVTPVMNWARKLGWTQLEEAEEAASRNRLRELKAQASRTQADVASTTKELYEENDRLLAVLALENGANGLENHARRRWVNQKMQMAGNKVFANEDTIDFLEKEARETMRSNKEEAHELQINLPVDIVVSPTDTVKRITLQLQKYFSDQPYHEDAMPDTIELWLDWQGNREKLGSRTTGE